MKINNRWTPEAVNVIRVMWNEGHSCSEIGLALGISRNSVIGVANRHGGFKSRKGRVARKTRPVRTRPTEAQRAAVKLAPVLVRAAAAPFAMPPLAVPLLDLQRGQCKWSVTDGDPHLFCGHETAPGKPWCAHHARRAVSTPVRTAEEIAGKAVFA